MSMIIDGTNGLTFNNATTQASAGSILQVQSVIKTDTFSTTSASFTDITGLSVSITPKFSTSKILVMVSLGATASNSNQGSQLFRLTRAGTAIGVGGAAGSRPQATFRMFGTSDTNTAYGGLGFQYLDSPATTSSTTYSLQACCQSGGTYYIVINSSYGDLNSSDTYSGREASTITVMEIAG